MMKTAIQETAEGAAELLGYCEAHVIRVLSGLSRYDQQCDCDGIGVWLVMREEGASMRFCLICGGTQKAYEITEE